MAQTTNDRYTVQDDDSGFLESFSKLQDALNYATENGDRPGISVFDRMAKYGGRQLWEFRKGSLTCVQKRSNRKAVPMCYRCNVRKAQKLTTPSPFDRYVRYCSLECAATDGVDAAIAIVDEWCPRHFTWFNSSNGCPMC